MLNPPICRVGGKSKLRKTILGMINTGTYLLYRVIFWSRMGLLR